MDSSNCKPVRRILDIRESIIGPCATVQKTMPLHIQKTRT